MPKINIEVDIDNYDDIRRAKEFLKSDDYYSDLSEITRVIKNYFKHCYNENEIKSLEEIEQGYCEAIRTLKELEEILTVSSLYE